MKTIFYPFPKEPFLNPEDVVESFSLKEGEKVIDFGAGSGFWTIPMAKKVGKKGHVFVVDARKENLAVIKNKANREGLENLSYYIAPYECTEMPITTKVDLILFSNLFSIINTDKIVFKQLKKISKKNTRLVVIEWKKEAVIGPKKEDRIDPGEVISNAEKAGFNFRCTLSAGSQHTGLLFVYNG